MLENIFIISFEKKNGRIHPDSSVLHSLHKKAAYMAYPDEDLFESTPEIVQTILSSQKWSLAQNLQKSDFTDDFFYQHAKALNAHGLNLLVAPLPFRNVLGLIFSHDTNPLDYRNELTRLLTGYVLEKYFSKPNHNDKTALLLTLFVDIRKYGEESLLFNPSPNQVNFYRGEPFVKLFVFGLDYAGKSSLMRLLATGKYDQDFFVPTKKFRITNFALDSGVKLSAWDMPGQAIFREDWLRGAQSSNILLFLLDVADQDRFEEARETFANILNLYELKAIPLIFLLNKIDLMEGAVPQSEIVKLFGLQSIQNRSVHVIQTSLPQRAGIDALKTVINQIISELLISNGIGSPFTPAVK